MTPPLSKYSKDTLIRCLEDIQAGRPAASAIARLPEWEDELIITQSQRAMTRQGDRFRAALERMRERVQQQRDETC